jgi:hypothetical protein
MAFSHLTSSRKRLVTPALAHGATGCLCSSGSAMSHRAIAASLALTGLSTGERLVVFALASYANREQRAWPGTRLAAARAGLGKSQYLAGLGALVERGLVEIEDSGGGRADPHEGTGGVPDAHAHPANDAEQDARHMAPWTASASARLSRCAGSVSSGGVRP